MAYSSPQLWSRIAVTDREPEKVLLQGAVIYDTVAYLCLVLSCTQASHLQVELCIGCYPSLGISKVTLPSAMGLMPVQIAMKPSTLSSTIRY